MCPSFPKSDSLDKKKIKFYTLKLSVYDFLFCFVLQALIQAGVTHRLLGGVAKAWLIHRMMRKAVQSEARSARHTKLA